MSGGGYFHSGDNINAVVADIGSYATKIGFAGEDFPKAYFRSVRAHVLITPLTPYFPSYMHSSTNTPVQNTEHCSETK